MFRLVSLIIGYAFGCLQSADLIVRRKDGGNIRNIGTGNPGASNVADQFGAKAGIVTLFLDMAKTILAILLCFAIFRDCAFSSIALNCGLGAIVGHCWPIQKRFKGGRGIACMFGIALILNWRIFLLLFFGEVLGALLTSYMIGGALGATFMFLLGLVLFNYSLEVTLLGFVICCAIMIRHTEKIKGMLRGEELKFSVARILATFKKKED